MSGSIRELDNMFNKGVDISSIREFDFSLNKGSIPPQ